VKLSQIVHNVAGRVATDLEAYRADLDHLRGIFGEDRVIFGSDWPNSDGAAPVDRIFAVATGYFSTLPRPVAEKYFWKNSIAAYKWTPRDSSQPRM